MSSVAHHVAIRVADIEAAVGFYETVFAATRLGGTVTVDGDFAEQIVGGPPGTTMQLQAIAFPDGGALELFSFPFPQEPTGPREAWNSTLMHLAVEVADVDASLAAVEAAGGRRAWPEVAELGPLRVIYVFDLDGNTLELIDGSMAEAIDAVTAALG